MDATGADAEVDLDFLDLRDVAMFVLLLEA
jgi:hypothetical protein